MNGMQKQEREVEKTLNGLLEDFMNEYIAYGDSREEMMSKIDEIVKQKMLLFQMKQYNALFGGDKCDDDDE